VVDVDDGLKRDRMTNETQGRRTIDERIQALLCGHAGTDRGWSSRLATVRWGKRDQTGRHSTTGINLSLYTPPVQLFGGGNPVGCWIARGLLALGQVVASSHL